MESGGLVIIPTCLLTAKPRMETQEILIQLMIGLLLCELFYNLDTLLSIADFVYLGYGL